MASIETYVNPSLVYRYRPLGIRRTDSREVRAVRAIVNREMEAIEGHYLYCPTFAEMNDPMEGLYASTQQVTQNADYEEFVRDVRNEKLGIGIASFCETWDNELMWAHYADGFRGICVAYSFAELIRTLNENHSLVRVAYGDKLFNMDLSGRHHSDRAKAILSTKNLMWRYEREWRLFAPRPGPARHGPHAVEHVYLGARIAPQDRTIVVKRLKAAGIEIRDTIVDGYSIEEA